MNERQTDFELLRDFARRGDQEAFATVVRRHIDLVYATALRKVENEGTAEEIAQNVFAVLARKSWQFAPDDSLAAWLFRTTLLEARQWWRGELRRRRREQTAAELGTTMKTPDEQSAFRALIPMLDEALLSLREKDRTALLLRFYEHQSLREVGATLGVGEDAAQKRVAGALQRLADFFRRRGYRTATIAATAAAMQHTAVSAPSFMAASVAQVTVQSAPAVTGITVLLARLLALTKLQKALLCAALLAVPALWHWNEKRTAGNEAGGQQMEMATDTAPEQPRQTETQTRIPAPAPEPAPELATAKPSVIARPRPQKAYGINVRGLVNTPDLKMALLEIVHHSSSARPIMVQRIMTEGEVFDDLSIKGAYAHFKVLQVGSSLDIRLREDGQENVYQLEGRYSLSPDKAVRPDKVNVCIITPSSEEFLEFYGGVLGRTVLCHPMVKRFPFSVAAEAEDRAAAIAVLESALRVEAKAATILDGDKFALVVPIDLVKSVSATVEQTAYPASTNNIVPVGTINLGKVALQSVLPLYGELIGRKWIQNRASPSWGAISFHGRTPLTKAEVVYAFDILFGWQGLKVVLVGEDSFKVIAVKSP
jgi:RNA polymerase sigma factor (sigma-70 family)